MYLPIIIPFTVRKKDTPQSCKQTVDSSQVTPLTLDLSEKIMARQCKCTEGNVLHLAIITAAEWKPMYQPSAEQAEKDRQAAYEAGVPHGQYVTKQRELLQCSS